MITKNSSFRILLVDDNRNFLKVLKFLLHKSKTIAIDKIDEVYNGKDAIEMARMHSYDLIFMDVNMPETDGILATETIKKENSHQKIIALSLNSSLEFKNSMLLAGADDYILKDELNENRLEQLILKSKKTS